MSTVKKLIAGSFIALLAGCTGDSATSTTDEKIDHVWRTQTDALDKAREVGGILNETALGRVREAERD